MTLIPDLQRDLVDAAERVGGSQRFGAPLRLAAAGVAGAALIAAALVLFAPDRSDRSPSSGDAAPPPPSRTGPKPHRGVRPVPGSFSDPVRFDFDGVSYSLVGYRGRGETTCMRLVQGVEGPGQPLVANTCAGDRLLRRELPHNPVRIVGRGGAEPTFVDGFARADVVELALVAPRYPSRAVLSAPWRPKPPRGKAIRFFSIAIDLPPDAGRDFPLHTRIRLRGRLASGRTVESIP